MKTHACIGTLIRMSGRSFVVEDYNVKVCAVQMLMSQDGASVDVIGRRQWKPGLGLVYKLRPVLCGFCLFSNGCN